MQAREHGEIVTYNGSYAFIRPDSGEKDLFAHSSQLPDGNIHRGDRVSYDQQPDKFKPGRMCATSVRFVDDSKNGPPSDIALAEGLQRAIGAQGLFAGGTTNRRTGKLKSA